MAMAVAAPASVSSALVCPNTSGWYLEYMPNVGYGLDARSYAALVRWCEEAGVAVPTTGTFTYEYVDRGIFYTRGAVEGYTHDPQGVISFPYDASHAPETTALAFSGGTLVGSIPLMEKQWAQNEETFATLKAALPMSYGAPWESQRVTVIGYATATLTFGRCTATFTQFR